MDHLDKLDNVVSAVYEETRDDTVLAADVFRVGVDVHVLGQLWVTWLAQHALLMLIQRGARLAVDKGIPEGSPTRCRARTRGRGGTR